MEWPREGPALFFWHSSGQSFFHSGQSFPCCSCVLLQVETNNGHSPSDSKHSSFDTKGSHGACPCRSIQFWWQLLLNMWSRQINAALESGRCPLNSWGKLGLIIFVGKVRGSSIKTYIGHGHEVLDVAIAEDNSRLASCGGDKLVFYWVRKKILWNTGY